MIPSAPPAQPGDVETTKEVREASLEILYMDWEVMELDKTVQALQNNRSSCGPSASLLDFSG